MCNIIIFAGEINLEKYEYQDDIKFKQNHHR